MADSIGDPSDPADGASTVGRVLGTEDATPLTFHVALNEDSYLQLDDVVRHHARQCPGRRAVTIAGVVTAGPRPARGRQFGSDVFLISDGVLPARVQETAEITTTRVEPECLRAAAPRGAGSPRRRRRPRARAVLRPDGPQAARSAWAATASRSTSTSTSSTAPAARTSPSAASPGWPPRPASRLFLLHSIFRSGVLARDGGQRQGADLHRSRARTCCSSTTPTSGWTTTTAPGVRAARAARRSPSPSVGFFAPPRPGRPHRPPARAAGRTSGVDAFWWTLASSAPSELLPYVFADAEDERHQYTMVVHQVAARLRLGRRSPPDGRRRQHRRHACRTYDELVDFIVDRLTDDDTRAALGRRRSPARAPSTRSSAGCLIARAPARAHPRATCPTPARRADLHRHQQVTVVDLHNLPERAQRFVVGVVARRRDRPQGGRRARRACCSP